jgi:eukaryotic-like serine/threonine-protein kinase
MSMRKFFRFVLMAMILIAVGLMSALTAMRVAIHGRETSVPNFVKLTPSEAERTAMTNGLSVTLEGQFYSSDVAEGRIVSQVPAPGSRVRRGWRVRLAQSLGPQRVVIPSVIGESPRAAELNVRQRGLELGYVAEIHLPNVPTDQIIAQSPPPNAVGVQSPKLNVLIAAEPEPQEFVMPNFVGHPLSEVSAAIEAAGLKIEYVGTAQLTPNDAVPNGSIVTTTVISRQTPSAGQKVTSDTPIALEVSH